MVPSQVALVPEPPRR